MSKADGATEVVAERPVLQQKGGHERKGHAKQRHEQVSDGHVHDEQVGDRVHLRREGHHVAHQPVASQCHHEDRHVHEINDRLEHDRGHRTLVSASVVDGRFIVGDVRFVHDASTDVGDHTVLLLLSLI